MESITFSIGFSVSEGGLEKALELLHMMLAAPRWLETSFKRAIRDAKIQAEEDAKSLDATVARRLMERMAPGDQRFQQPTAIDADALEMSQGQAAILSLLTPGLIEVTVVGDFEPQALERAASKYLGSLPPRALPSGLSEAFHVTSPMYSLEASRVTIEDSVERSLLMVAMDLKANRWTKRTPSDETEPLLRAYRELRVLCAMVNNILFCHVREKLGLAYEISFELSLPSHYSTGMAILRCSPRSADELESCFKESMTVLCNLRKYCTEKEFAKAIEPMIKSTQASLHTNGFWMAQLNQLQDDSVPHNFASFSNVVEMYKGLTCDGVLRTAEALFDPSTDRLVRVEGVTTVSTPAGS